MPPPDHAGRSTTSTKPDSPPCNFPGASATERVIERSLGKLARLEGAPVAALPDVTLLRVRTKRRSLLYALVHDKAHANVAFMFGEDESRLPEQHDVSTVSVEARGT